MDEQSLTIGSFHGAPFGAMMHSLHVQPAVGRRGKLDNECLYLYHPSHRLDLQSPLALTPISLNHSPEFIDNLYLTCVYSNESATTSAFLLYIYIPKASSDDIANILSMELDEIQRNGELNPTNNHKSSMTVHPSRTHTKSPISTTTTPSNQRVRRPHI